MPLPVVPARLLRRSALSTFAVLALLAVSVLSLPAPAQAARSCGIAYNDVGPYGVAVDRGRVSCSAARRVLRRYFSSRAACEGSSCVRRQRGWTCQTAAAFAYPRLASCQRGRLLVRAIAIAD